MFNLRICEKNKQLLYVSTYIGEIEEVDEYGFYTGNIIESYSTPTATKVSIYPSYGRLANEIFGANEQFDYMMVAMGTPFTEKTIFYNPDNVTFNKPDYYIHRMKKSLNTTYYGLRKMV